MVDQIDDLFRKTHKEKTEQVARIRGQWCGDTELTGYLANATGPVPLVLDLHIVHDRFGSRSDPSISGHLHYPNDWDGSLNESVADKIRQYHTDYNNRPSNTISFLPDIPSTSGRLDSELVYLLFLQVHRETDHFFAVSGVQIAQSDRVQFHYRRTVPSRNPVYARRVDPSALAFSLSTHRYSYVGLLFISLFFRLIINIFLQPEVELVIGRLR